MTTNTTTHLPAPPGSDAVGLVALPWHLNRRGEHLGAGPEAILNAGLQDWLQQAGYAVSGPRVVELDDAERSQYGGWHAVGLTGAHLAETVAATVAERAFPLALLGDCNGALGMLAGLRRAGTGRLGMVWFDAHGDFNTPETTRSGYLGGMPVAVSSGLCLQRLRLQAGLEPPLSLSDIVLAGVRDTDPEEQEQIEAKGLASVEAADLVHDRTRLRQAMDQLSAACDAIYIHIDLDVLDPDEAPGMNFPVPGGPSVAALGQSVALCLSYPKASALGIASYNAPKDEAGRTLAGVFRLIGDSLQGLAARTE